MNRKVPADFSLLHKISTVLELTHFLNQTALVDLGGVPGARPQRVQILSFQHTKFAKHNRLGSQHPPTRSTPPHREILYPPLDSKQNIQYNKNRKSLDTVKDAKMINCYNVVMASKKKKGSRLAMFSR